MVSTTRLTPSLGAEIIGVDLARTIEPGLMDEVVGVLDHAGVVILRGQKLTVDQFMAFSRRVGPLAVHSLKQFSKPGLPELMVASNIVEDGKAIGLADGGQHWHTDGAYLDKPYRATILYSLEIPVRDGKAVGDTMFASTAAAYDALAPEMKNRLAPLRALHCHGVARARMGKSLKLEQGQEQAMKKGVEHPVIRTHPHTGRKCLYVNPGSTLSLCGMDAGDSDALLKTLFEHVVRPEFVYRHNWRVGDIVMWDNCSTQHCAVDDYRLPLRRLLHRTIVQGEAVH